MPGVDRTRQGARADHQAEGHAGAAGRRSTPCVLIADRYNFKLRLYKNLQLVKEYTVAVGAVGFDTPAGLYHIQNKAIDPAWHVPNSAWAGDLAGTVVPGGVPDNPLKARWLGIFDGAGIHGTDETYSLGHAASHGCIRMAIPDVIELYDQVPVGAPDLHRLGHTPISSIGTSSQPCSSSRFRRSVCRMQSVPMKMPRSRLRSTEYHIVEASLGPWIGCQGATGCSCSSASPASAS